VVQDSLVGLTDRPDLGEDGFDGVVVVTDDALVRDTVRYLGGNVGSPADMALLERAIRQAVLLEKLHRSGVDPGVVLQAVKPVELGTAKVSHGTLTGQSGEASFILAYAMSFVLYLSLLLYGMQVMTSTVEEKTNRINEVLVSSLTPFQLLLGKVVGVGSVGLLQLGIWAGTAYLLADNRVRIAGLLGATPDAATSLPIPAIEAHVLAVFLLFFLLGFLFFAAAYAAVGATCNTVQETQMASMPVTLFILAGLFAMFRLLNEPNGSLARILSLVPPLAPFVTPVRNSLSPVPIPELALSAAVTGLGVVAMAWVAGRIYRVGILMYGKRASPGEIWRWIRAG
jgi:ABC-2 type transport system permease protein